jgi:hypothetical protein
MTNEEIIEMAKQAGGFGCGRDFAIDFARLIASKQIEIDAKVCDGLQDFSASACAAAIRGRAR